MSGKDRYRCCLFSESCLSNITFSRSNFVDFSFSQKIIKCFRQVNSIQLNVNLSLISIWLIMMMYDSVVGKWILSISREKEFDLSSGADICSKCWTLMRFAMQIIDRVLHGLILHLNIKIIRLFNRGFRIWTSFMDLFRSTWCSLLDLWSNSERTSIKYSTSDRRTSHCSHCMTHKFSFNLSSCLLSIGWKRFS